MTLETYWPHYLRHHSNRTNRRLHFIGWVALVLLAAAALVTSNLCVFFAGIVMAYTLAWIGHFCFQREPPETFRHPLLANVSSLRMFALMASGRLEGHLARHGARE